MSRNLNDILSECTNAVRKGPEVTAEDKGDVKVVEVYAMPDLEELRENNGDKDFYIADCHFIQVAVDKAKAEELREEFEAWVEEYPHPEHFKNGTSYITVGANIGDQQAAFELFALGEALGMWDIMTPQSVLGITGNLADKMAGNGLIGVSGYKSN